MYLHTLLGCSPTPLAHYLKALGILRLAAEQKDPDARGFWKDDAFCLATKLSEEELERFFLDDYAPTPVVAPWNGGSGFWPKDNKSGIELLARSDAPRFAAYREAIRCVRESFRDLKETPKKEEKPRRIGSLRSELSEGAIAWLDAALMVGADVLRYPALLGTGGNDGRLDFTNNFMQRLMLDLFDEEGSPREAAQELLDAALFGRATKQGIPKLAIGQFLPAANAVNPWDFVLMIEGAIVLQVSAVRRLEGHELAQAAAPFAVQGRSSGYASASAADGSNGRGEQWLPLWSAPARFDEVKALFAEGRLKSGAKTVRQPVEAALAIRSLGSARGVESFQRYGFIERNGQANLAVPLGRWHVADDPALQPLREVIEWCERFLKKTAEESAALQTLARDLESACLDVCRDSRSPERWQSLLIRLGEAEDAIALRPSLHQGIKPLPRLSLAWVERAAAPSAEFRLALALASQSGDKSSNEAPEIRAHCLPFSRFNTFDATQAPRVVWSPAASLTDNLIAVLQRRLMESQRSDSKHLMLKSYWPASMTDIERFIAGDVDDRRIAALARGLMAVDFSRWDKALCDRIWERLRPEQTSDQEQERWLLSPLHALFRLCLLRAPLEDETVIPTSSAVLRLLASGQLSAAGRRAIQHLGAHGLRVKLTQTFGAPAFAQRLAATLAFPVSRRPQYRALVDAVTKPDAQEDAVTA